MKLLEVSYRICRCDFILEQKIRKISSNKDKRVDKYSSDNYAVATYLFFNIKIRELVAFT